MKVTIFGMSVLGGVTAAIPTPWPRCDWHRREHRQGGHDQSGAESDNRAALTEIIKSGVSAGTLSAPQTQKR